MFSAEKLSPVLTLWRYKTFSQAVTLVADITRFSGYGHSCGIHSKNEEHINELALNARVSRIMVNQTQTFGNSGVLTMVCRSPLRWDVEPGEETWSLKMFTGNTF